LKTPNSKFFNYPEVVEISDTDDEQTTADTTKYEYSASEMVSEKSNWDKVSAIRNNRGVQRELSALSHESDSTNNSEYPKTSLTGVASIYNVSGWDPNEAKQAFGIANIQYSYRNPGNIQQIQKCLFLGVSVHKNYHSCQGIKIYEFSSPELNVVHTSIDLKIN
ncbi:21798_t:CDS:2, partial [Racocetra persica]